MHLADIDCVTSKHHIKALLLENVSPAAINMFREEGYDVDTRPEISEEELIKIIPEYHILGVRSKTNVTKRVIENASQLLAIGCFCIGTDQTDLDAATEHAKAVFNAPFANTRSVAEMVLGEIVMLSRQLGDRNIECHEGLWNKVSKNCFELRGKVLGIVGYGHVGSQLSILAEAMGMIIRYYDIAPKLGLGNAVGCSSLQYLLSISDFVSLHVPLKADTENLISDTEIFQYMKKGSYLINAARGKVVDVDAVAKALKEGHLAGAAFDVYPQEPASGQEELVTPLRGLPNVVLTPHIGGSTEEAQENIGKEVAQKLISFINTGSTIGVVNLPESSLPMAKSTNRILNFHKNQPGVLRDINKILSEYNVRGQMLMTKNKIGYLIVDVEATVSEEIRSAIFDHPSSLKTRAIQLCENHVSPIAMMEHTKKQEQ